MKWNKYITWPIWLLYQYLIGRGYFIFYCKPNRDLHLTGFTLLWNTYRFLYCIKDSGVINLYVQSHRCNHYLLYRKSKYIVIGKGYDYFKERDGS
jgi:hypothetical protein